MPPAIMFVAYFTPLPPLMPILHVLFVYACFYIAVVSPRIRCTGSANVEDVTPSSGI